MSFNRMENIYNRILDKFFDENTDPEAGINYEKFVEFLREIKIEIISNKFSLYDTEHKGDFFFI